MYSNLLRLRLVIMIAFLAILAGSAPPIMADSSTLPYGKEQAQYRLREWSPELADELIEALEAYPDSLPPEKRGYLNGGYNWAFRYAELARLEAIYRFPDATNATEWA